MPIPIFLVGEGPGDIGGLASDPPYQTDQPGFLQPVLRRLLNSEVAFSGKKMSALGKDRIKTPTDALTHKAMSALLLAEQNESEILVFITDLDGGSELRRQAKAKAAIKGMLDAIRAGVDHVSDSPVQCVPGVACRTIEAWALADIAAVEALANEPVTLPKRPEKLWGKPHDPDSDHPKQVLKRIMGSDDWEILSEIAERADVTIIREICTLSFDPFAAELQRAASAYS